MEKIIVFDIETIADIEIAKRLLNIQEGSDEEILTKLVDYHSEIANGNTFFRQMFWKIVCLSYVEANLVKDDNGAYYSVKNVRTAGNIDSAEEDVIQKFSEFCKKNTPRLISFNGKTFDIPVLKYRAMKYKIQFDWFYQEIQVSQYKREATYHDKWGDKYNYDLLDFYKPKSGGVKMSEICAAFDIPCKIEGSGDGVQDMYNRGEIERIRNYCETDVLATFALFLVAEYHMNNINLYGYQKSFENLIEYGQNNKEIAHIYEFCNMLQTSHIIHNF